MFNQKFLKNEGNIFMNDFLWKFYSTRKINLFISINSGKYFVFTCNEFMFVLIHILKPISLYCHKRTE